MAKGRVNLAVYTVKGEKSDLKLNLKFSGLAARSTFQNYFWVNSDEIYSAAGEICEGFSRF